MPRASYSLSALRLAPLRFTTSPTFIDTTVNPAPWGRVKSEYLPANRYVTTLQGADDVQGFVNLASCDRNPGGHGPYLCRPLPRSRGHSHDALRRSPRAWQ